MPPRSPTTRPHPLLSVLDALLPQTCIACDTPIPTDLSSEGGPLCQPCQLALTTGRQQTYCPHCARTMPTTAIHEKRCARCRTEHFWNVAGVARVGAYSEPALRRPIINLKFTGSERTAAWLGDLLATAIRSQPWGDDIEALVPVPMHLLRRVQRPSNHALDLARATSRQLGVPVQRAAIRRVKYAASQTRAASRTQRFANVKNCFGPARRPNIAGKTVCIVDNLLVTGATICEVSKVLRRAGAKKIYAAVIARANPPRDPEAQGIVESEQFEEEV